MLLPIRRWRAAVIGVVIALAGPSAASLSAGVVAPMEKDPLPHVEPSASAAAPELAIALPLPAGDENKPQSFWYPGADGIDAVSISSVPIPASTDQPLPTSAFPGTQQHPLIPLPGAAWTGMAGLVGLGAVKLLRNFRRLLA